MGAFLSALFLLVQVQASPYRNISDDYLAASCSFFIVIIFVVASWFDAYLNDSTVRYSKAV